MTDKITNTSKPPFMGPLFIVGWPRSGTKLLRDLLNRHPGISIPTSESHFIPQLINKFGWNPVFDNNLLTKIYETFLKTTFCRFKNRNPVFDIEYFQKKVDRHSWNTVFEFIFRHYASIKDKNVDFIWGDKTPQYLEHIETLKKIFPNAKFIHIIRDPRDCCLSNKRAWGKNVYRSAHRWAKIIKKARQFGGSLGNDYLEVYYEQLLDNPQEVLKNICDYLGCNFFNDMLKLDKPSENLGDAKNSIEIVRDNKNKYREHLSNKEIRKIEEIVCPVARELGYELENDITHRRLKPFFLSYYKLLDMFAQLNFNIKDRGLFEGSKFTIQEYVESKPFIGKNR